MGISEVTYYDWIKRGKAGEEPFLKFLKSIKKARAKAVISNVLVIQTAGKKSWQAAAWWLERTHFKDWGIRKQFEGTGEGEPIKLVIEYVDKKSKGNKNS